MSKLVLIAIDSAQRELFGCSLLASYLRSMGMRVILCSTWTFREYYARYRPDAVVWPNAFWDLSDIAKASRVFVMPSESGNGQPELEAHHGGLKHNPVFPDTIERFFCWGVSMREVLLETGRWRDEQLVVTGNPLTDHWLLPRPDAECSTKPIGLATSLKFLGGLTPRQWNCFQLLDLAERTGGDGVYFFPPEHAESWLFLEASVARVMVTLVRSLTDSCSVPIVIRPHPFERGNRYQYFTQMTKGRTRVTRQGTVSQWLDGLSILFTVMSGSALDAVVRGVPVVSLKGMLDPDANRKMPRHYHFDFEKWLWQIDEVGQARDYVEMALKGKLGPCQDEHKMQEFLARHFSFPRTSPAALQIATAIQAALDSPATRKTVTAPRRPKGIMRNVKEICCRYVPLFPQLMTVAKYFYYRLPGQFSLGWSYLPWRVGERWAAAKYVKQVRALVEC